MAFQRTDILHAIGVFADLATTPVALSSEGFDGALVRNGVGNYTIRCTEQIGFLEAQSAAWAGPNENALCGATITTPGVVEIRCMTSDNVPIDPVLLNVEIKQIQTGPVGTHNGTVPPAPPPPPGGPVTSVFGRVGAVVATLGDYTSSLITNASGVAGATVTDALDALDAAIAGLVTGVSSVFGRTGAVVATLGDYTSSLITNASSVAGATVTDALDALAASSRSIAYVSGFVGDAGTPANRRGYTRGSDPLSALNAFTAVALVENFYADSEGVPTDLDGGVQIFGTLASATGNGWGIIINGQTLGARFVSNEASQNIPVTISTFRPCTKWMVVHFQVFRLGGATFCALFVNGSRYVINDLLGAAGYVAGADLCVGVFDDGAVTRTSALRVNGVGYSVTAMTDIEIAAHAQLIQEQGQLVQTPSGTALADGWRVDPGVTPDATNWASFLAGAALSTINTTALPEATKSAPIVWA